MKVTFTQTGFDDLNYWAENDIKTVKKIIRLINSIKKDPFVGLGKPESLKYDFAGFWSRRINLEHRLIYKVEGSKGQNQKCTIIQCRYHY